MIRFAALLALLLASTLSFAETLANVNGTPITREQVQREIEKTPDLAKDPKSVSNPLVIKDMLDRMIIGELLYQKAKSTGLQNRAEVKQQIAAVTRQVMANSLVQDYLSKNPISEDELKKHYDYLVTLEDKQDFHIRHILLKTEEDAKAVRAKIQSRNDFSEQVKLSSIDERTNKLGGDLGFFRPHQVKYQFGEAVLKMLPGDISEPTKTDYGWQIFEMLGIREIAPPTFEAARQTVANLLVQQRIKQLTDELRANAKVKVLVPE